MRKFAVVMALFLVLCSSLALAEIEIITYGTSASFSVAPGTAPSYSLCQCGTSTDSIIITNTGDVANNYAVSSSAPGLVSFSETTVSLLPGKSATIYVFIRAPCDGLLDEEVSFSVIDAFGNEKAFAKPLAVNKCQNVQASLSFSAEQPITPCTPVNYTVLVNNTGSFTEEYLVSFGGEDYAQYFDQPVWSLVLPAGDAGVAKATMRLDCSLSGPLTIPFSVEAQQNGLVADLEHMLTVEPAYDFSGAFQADPICERTGGKVSFVLRNDASFENSFSLSSNASFALDAASAVIAPGDDRTFSLTVPPGTAPGTYAASLVVTEETGGTTKSFSGEVEVLSCFGVAIDVIPSDDPVRGCADTYSFPLIVTNTGVDDETILLSADHAAAHLQNDSLVLAPGESAEIPVEMVFPADQAFDGTVTFDAVVAGVANVSATDAVSFSLVSSEECYRPQLLPRRVKVPLEAGEASFTLRNDGWREATYAVHVASDVFTVDDSRVTIAPGSEAAVVLEYEPDVDLYRRYALDVTVNPVDDEWVHTFSVIVVLDRPTLVEEAVWHLWTHPCQLLTLIFLILLVAGLITLFVRRNGPRVRVKGLLPVLLLVWVIVVIVVLAWRGLPGPLYEPVVQDDNDPLTIYIPEDESYAVDLSSFFIDPDQDNLSFMVSGMDEVLVSVDGRIATFTPRADFAGKEDFMITAFDGHGGATESPQMYVVVVDRPELTTWNVYVTYCAYVNLVLLLLLVFLADALFMRKQKPLPPVAKKQGRKKSKK